MIRSAAVALLALLAIVVVGCGWYTQSTHRPLDIPASGQRVDLVATDSALDADPATVHVGWIYFVLDNELPGGRYRLVALVEQEPGTGEPGPLPPIDASMITVCTAEQYASAVHAPNGVLGYCGAEVVRATPTEGRYTLIVLGDVVFNNTGDGTPFEFVPISESELPTTVLDVLP